MDAIRLGPLVFSLDRFAALAGVAVFLAVVWLAGRWRGGALRARLDAWSWRVLLVGFVVGRGAHVAAHWDSFAGELWRVVAFWQGGFSAQWAFVAAGLVTLLELGRRDAGPPMGRPVALSLAAGLAVWGGLMLSQGPLQAPGPPQTVFRAVNGQALSLAERDGRPAVVNLWATWCAPCRRELPMMAELAEAHPGIDVIFANQREPQARVGLFLATEGLRLPLLVLDEEGALGRHYAALGLPTTVFLDADGAVAEKHVGEISREAFAAGLARLEAGAPRTVARP